MSMIEDLRMRWAEMDEIDRKNFGIAVIGVILVIIMIWQVSRAMGGISAILGSGSEYVNESYEGMRQLGGVE